LFRALKKKEEFEWSDECENAFSELKKILASPPVLAKLDLGEGLYLYLVVAKEVISAVLIKEVERVQKPIYFFSKALQGSELNYQKLEKLAYALIVAARRL